MTTSKETELRQRWSIASFELPFASPKEAEIVADWFINELSLALQEKIKEVEKIQRKIVETGIDEQGRRFEIVENSVSLDEVIKILKQ